MLCAILKVQQFIYANYPKGLEEPHVDCEPQFGNLISIAPNDEMPKNNEF
jgi:hypothetical protein